MVKNEKDLNYKLFRSNCKNFAKRLFDKIARAKYFDYTTAEEFMKNLFIGLLFVILFVSVVLLFFRDTNLSIIITIHDDPI